MSHDRFATSLRGSQMVFQIGPSLEKPLDAVEPGTTKIYYNRKPHPKSRRGCLACKKARVKCDEVKPCCQRCQGKKISCHYADLNSQSVPCRARLARRQTAHMDFCARLQPGPQKIWLGDKHPFVLTFSDPDNQFGSGNDLMLLHHFQSVTSRELNFPTLDEESENVTLKLAMENPYLMHAVLAVGATQLRRFRPQDHDIRSSELAHWQNALSSFRDALNCPFTRGNDLSPSKSWVFSDSPQQLGWLYIQLGLRHLLEQTKPFHIDTKLRPIFIASDDSQGTFSDERPGIDGLPPELVKVCDLDDSSTPENNPYHSSVRLLTPLLTLKRCDSNLFKFLHWFASVDERFASLLQRKDHPAMLLLSYWLGILCELDKWWCRERAKRECTAICMLLKNCGSRDIVRLLDYPAMACGYPLRDTLT